MARPLTLFFGTLFLAGCATTPAQGPVAQDRDGCAWRVCVRSIDSPDGRTYLVDNGEPVRATILLDFNSVRNLRSDRSFPVELIVPANGRGVLAEFDAIEEGRPFSARPTVSIDLGAPDIRPDVEFLYTMPFGGREPREIIQAFNGEDTHQLGMRYAIDIAMPEGTPVVAARGGTVVYVQDGFTRGGRDPDLLEGANIVIIAHDDESMASYGHLSAGIPVSVGETVEQGQFIAFSGNTGFTGQPHLHFHVGVRLLRDPGRSIPVRLKDAVGEEIFPYAGMMVAPSRVRSASTEGRSR